MNLPNDAESPLQGGGDVQGEGRLSRRPGDPHKTITMAQIAKAAGVSQGAISSLLNDRDYGIRVSEKTRERVFKVCREMGYIPNDLRAVVRMYPELGEFCLLLSSRCIAGLADPFLSRIAAAAMAATPIDSRSVTLSAYDEELDYLAEPEHLPVPVRSGVASKFVCWGPPNLSLVQTLLRRGYPVVCLGYDLALPGVVSIVPDYQRASQLALEHLLGLGHQHVAIISGPFGSTDPQLIELNHGVQTAFVEANAPLAAQNIIYGDLTHEAGVTAYSALQEHTPAPTAVFCMSDAAATGVITEARRRGHDVPARLSIVGCGDDLFSQFTCPALTTVHIPAEEMAARGIAEIDRLVRVEAPSAAKREVLPVRLVERASCAVPTG